MAKQENTNNDWKKNALIELLLFYVPLGLYSMIMMSSHSVINSGVARVPNSEMGLAAFTVTMSIMNMFASPGFASQQMVIAYARDRESLKTIQKVMLKILLAAFLTISIVAFTPVRELVFLKIFNTPPELMGQVNNAVIFTISLPLIYITRSLGQGVIISQKKTIFSTISVSLRILFMIFLAFLIPTYTNWEGASVGIIIWTAGMGLEAIVTFLLSRLLVKDLPKKADVHQPGGVVTQRQAFSFVLPLILVSLIWSLGGPVLNTGLSLTSNPKVSLATYQVARSFAFIFIAFLENNMRQVSLLFATSDDREDYIRKFSLVVSLILSSIIALMALTPIGDFLLINVIGVTPAIAASSKPVLTALLFIPLIAARSEVYMGLLMRLGKTTPMTYAKIASMVTTTLTVILCASIIPDIGALAGGLGLIMGYGAELLTLRYFHRTARARLSE